MAGASSRRSRPSNSERGAAFPFVLNRGCVINFAECDVDVSFCLAGVEGGGDFLREQGAFRQERICRPGWQVVLARFALAGAPNNLTGLLAAVGHELTGLDFWDILAGLPLRFAARADFVFTLFGRTSQQTCTGAIRSRQLRHRSPGCGAYGFHCGGCFWVFLFSTVAGGAHAGVELSDADCADGISGRRP